MKIEVHPDDDLVARKAAAIIAADARAAVPLRFIMAVSGGHTPWLMLRALADEQLPWEHVHVLQVDERAAPAGDPDRNLTHLRESLLDHAPLRPDHIHAMPVEAVDLERAAEQYALTWTLRVRRRCSTSFISVLDRTATPHRWCLEIRSLRSPTQTSRRPAPTWADVG